MLRANKLYYDAQLRTKKLSERNQVVSGLKLINVYICYVL